jgi:hypothetical protein
MKFRGILPEIEAKNLMIIEDQLNHEALAAKKSELYAEYFADPTLKSCAQQLAKHHKDNFMNLLNYLDSH